VSLFNPDTIAGYPTATGVYLMRDTAGAVIYVGKAKNLRQRLKQYFSGHDERAMIPHLLERLADIECIVVSNEHEALLLENNLIKQHWPRYNALLKDDRIFFSLRLTAHSWPAVELVRRRGKAQDRSLYFGPYPSAWAAYQILEVVKQLFPLRRCSDREFAARVRPCILYEMGKCLAPCVQLCSHDEYAALTQKVKLFLKGDDRTVLENLKRDLEAATEALEFERAQIIYKTIQALEHGQQRQSVDQASGKSLDAWGIHREGARVALAQLIFRDGKLIGMETYNFQEIWGDDSELLASVLMQVYTHAAPPLLLLPIALPDCASLEAIFGMQTPVSVRSPTRGELYSLVEMAQRNAAAAFQKQHQATIAREEVLQELQRCCGLDRYPERIEVIDSSHLAGSDAVSVVVSFKDGAPNKAHYRKYILKYTAAADDYGALREVLQRRFRRQKDDISATPDLLLIDGGEAHLKLAQEILEELGVAAIIDVIAISKESGRHDKGLNRELIHAPALSKALELPAHAPVLKMLQVMRDEAHRFALEFQRSRRRKTALRSSLDECPGIGPVKRRALLKHFGSLKQIRAASAEELLACPSITKRDLSKLLEWMGRDISEEEKNA